MAAKAGIRFDPPVIIQADALKDVAVVCVTGYLGDQSVWSFGEASPKNNKNAYCFSMAEKRAVDRVTLKLLGLHGEIYSEEEADAFRDVVVTVTQKEPAVDAATEDESQSMREILFFEIDAINCPNELMNWGKNSAATIAGLTEEHQKEVRVYFSKRKADLKQAA